MFLQWSSKVGYLSGDKATELAKDSIAEVGISKVKYVCKTEITISEISMDELKEELSTFVRKFDDHCRKHKEFWMSDELMELLMSDIDFVEEDAEFIEITAKVLAMILLKRSKLEDNPDVMLDKTLRHGAKMFLNEKEKEMVREVKKFLKEKEVDVFCCRAVLSGVKWLVEQIMKSASEYEFIE